MANEQSMSEHGIVRDGMLIEWDVEIPMDDGVVLRADVFRPVEPGEYPVILHHGPYAKGLAFQDGYPDAWQRMVASHPDTAAGSTNAYQSWELVDPEKWVPHGYACVRVDTRGAGRSPGFLDCWSPRETRDFFACIEWCGTQDWSTGKVGLSGISYYAINQWQVAALNPPHLAALCVWEGAADIYRDITHHGGILSTFLANWYDMQVASVQHGLGDRGRRSRVTGELISGPESLSDERLLENRGDLGSDVRSHPFDDDYFRARKPDLSKITVPFLSAGNWGGNGLHLRGNVEGFVRAASPHKWLEMHGLDHWTEFYTDYGTQLQRRFFDYFLKGVESGWEHQPPVQLQVRKVDGFVLRMEHEWPLARTRWTRLYINPIKRSLDSVPNTASGAAEFEALGEGLTFFSEPLLEETEITGPSAVKLFVSSSTTDADVFCVLRVYAADDREVVFQGALDPHTPIGQGWLRASHRKLDPELSTPERPYHMHTEAQPLVPHEIVELEVEIWPTCIVIPAGYRIALTIRGKDYEYGGPPARLANLKNALTGCGPFLHDDVTDRPVSVFGGTTTLHAGKEMPSSLLLPVIPAVRSLVEQAPT